MEMQTLLDEIAEGTEIYLKDGRSLVLCDDGLWRFRPSWTIHLDGPKTYDHQGFASPLEALKAGKEKK